MFFRLASIIPIADHKILNFHNHILFSWMVSSVTPTNALVVSTRRAERELLMYPSCPFFDRSGKDVAKDVRLSWLMSLNDGLLLNTRMYGFGLNRWRFEDDAWRKPLYCNSGANTWRGRFPQLRRTKLRYVPKFELILKTIWQRE